jgi:hypothetical protein
MSPANAYRLWCSAITNNVTSHLIPEHEERDHGDTNAARDLDTTADHGNVLAKGDWHVAYHLDDEKYRPGDQQWLGCQTPIEPIEHGERAEHAVHRHHHEEIAQAPNPLSKKCQSREIDDPGEQVLPGIQLDGIAFVAEVRGDYFDIRQLENEPECDSPCYQPDQAPDFSHWYVSDARRHPCR